MGAKKGYTAKQYREGIRQAKGNVTEAAEALNVSRTAVYDAVRRYKTVRKELKKWRKTAVTEAEGRLYDAMRRDEEWAIRLILRTQRGGKWNPTEKHEHSGPSGGPVEVVLETDSPDPDGSG